MHQKQTLTSVAANPAGFASGVTGDTFTLTNNEVTGSNCAHKVTVLNNTVNDHSAKTLTITGTDENGKPQEETIAGPGVSATVTSSKFFKTTTGVVPSATIGADTFDIGWAAASRAAHVTPNSKVSPFNVGIGCTVSAGTPTFSLKYTFDRSFWFTNSGISGATASTAAAQTTPCSAMAIEFAAAGSLDVTYIQAGN